MQWNCAKCKKELLEGDRIWLGALCGNCNLNPDFEKMELEYLEFYISQNIYEPERVEEAWEVFKKRGGCNRWSLQNVARYGVTEKIVKEAWAKYKENGGNNWIFFINGNRHNGSDYVAEEAWEKYKADGGDDWGYFVDLGRTAKIRDEARKMFEEKNLVKIDWID